MYSKTTTISLALITIFSIVCCSHKPKVDSEDLSIVKEVEANDTLPESVKKFVKALATNDSDAFAEMVSYPLQRPYPLRNIDDAKQMRVYFHQMVDDSLRNIVKKAKPHRWKEFGWRGWSLDDGSYVWIDESVYSMQYISQKEQKTIDSLTNEEIKTIEPSIREGWKPIMCMLNSDNGRVYRVDSSNKSEDSDTRHYRLVVYEGHSDLRGLPAELLDGIMEMDGSAGTALYKFHSTDGREVILEPEAPDSSNPVLLEPNDSSVVLERAYWHELVKLK